MAPLRTIQQPLRLAAAGAFLYLSLFSLSGCTVVAVGAAAVSVTATAVGVAADVAVGTAKLAGKGVGAAYGAIADDKPDNSGLSIKYRESDPKHPWQPGPGMSNAREPELPEPARPARPAPQPAPTARPLPAPPVQAPIASP